MIIHILRDITTAEPHAHGVAQQVVLYPVDALAAVAHQRTAAVVGVVDVFFTHITSIRQAQIDGMRLRQDTALRIY